MSRFLKAPRFSVLVTQFNGDLIDKLSDEISNVMGCQPINTSNPQQIKGLEYPACSGDDAVRKMAKAYNFMLTQKQDKIVKIEAKISRFRPRAGRYTRLRPVVSFADVMGF